jgi:hypothetical protein
MSLPYVRSIPYLSPSALQMLEERPAEFYFRRLGPPEFAPPREEQSFPAAVGIAFDAMVKERIARERGFRCPSLDFMLNEVKCERERALAVAKTLMEGYAYSGAMCRLLDEKPQAVAVDGEDFAPGTRVPVRTRIDCIVKPGMVPVIHDWKTAGANRPGTRSPSQGYNRLWDTDQPGVPLGAHAKSGLPLEQLDSNWATQVVMYGWAQGYPVSSELTGSIDEVIAWHGARVRVAQFRAPITVEFQLGVKARLEEAWRRIEDRRVIDPNLTLEEARVLL